MPVGYMPNGEIDLEEAEIIKYIFEKIDEYHENPPKVLVDKVIKEYNNDRQNPKPLSYEEAKKLVSSTAIFLLIEEEYRNKMIALQKSRGKYPEYSELHHNFSQLLANSDITLRYSKGINGNPDPIISPETFKKAQAILEKERTI